jgi:hypothetical protein
VIDGLHALSIPYILVGSFSSNFYGIPRSTKDADFVIELGDLSVRDLAQQLGPAFRLDPQMTFESATGTRRFTLHLTDGSFEVELFLLSEDAHDQSRFTRRRSVQTLQREVFLPTPEDVIITKLRWFHVLARGKDREDVENILSVQSDVLDWEYLLHWCDQHGTRELLEEIRRDLSGE